LVPDIRTGNLAKDKPMKILTHSLMSLLLLAPIAPVAAQEGPGPTPAAATDEGTSTPAPIASPERPTIEASARPDSEGAPAETTPNPGGAALPTDSLAPTSENPTSDVLTPAADTMRIVDIEIVGTEFKDAVMLSMFTKPGDDVSAEQIRNDLRRIYGLGYFLDVNATRKPAEGGYTLVVMVQENPILKDINITNELRVFSKAAILEAFKEQVGKIANFNDIRDAKEKIETAYRNQGFALANMRILQERVSENNGLLSLEGTLDLQINEGVIEDIRVEGNQETKPYVILREITLKPGQLFNAQNMQADLSRVFNTNFFDGINLVPKPGEKDPSHFILVIEVKEKPTGSVNLGAGFNNRDGLIGTFSINKDNLMGEGRRLGVDLQFGVDVLSVFSQANSFQQAQRTLLGRIDFYDPWMFEGRTSFGASLFSERIPLFFGQGAQNVFNLNLGNGIIQSRVGSSLSFGRPLFGDLTSPWRGSLSVRAEQVGVTDLNRTPRRDLSVSNRFSATDVFFSVGGSISYDTRDIIIDPKRGWYGLLSMEPVWGDSAYLRFTGNLSTYLGVTDWLTLAFGVRGGSYQGQTPAYEQFYSNGFNVIRGYPENGFLFGKHFVIGSVEARLPIVNPISGVIFTDIGDFFPVVAERADLNQGLPFKYGVGLGIRLNTPMGPLRLDYGVRDFSKLGFNNLFDAGQIHFSIGQKF
jgi:outer membrane protein insertion porin family